MTIPLMSRVVEEGERHVFNTQPSMMPAEYSEYARKCWLASAQFLLTELSRASEGQEPWIWLAKDPHGNFVRTVKESDLLQAKASHALEVQSLETVLATMGVDYGAKIAELEGVVGRLRAALDLSGAQFEGLAMMLRQHGLNIDGPFVIGHCDDLAKKMRAALAETAETAGKGEGNGV